MDTRTIGDLHVSVVGLGCNNFGGRIDYDQTKTVVDAALNAGINFFDTADVYGGTRSEEFLGRALGSRRKDVIIASKFGFPIAGEGGGASPSYIRTAIEASLKRLGTDYLDLYQLHRPDDSVPIADTLGALTDLVHAGKVRAIGSSNFSVAQILAAEAISANGSARFVSVQNEYSLLQREPEQGVLDECARLHIGFLPYFPLASGLFTGKYRVGQATPEGNSACQQPSRFRNADAPKSGAGRTAHSICRVPSAHDFGVGIRLAARTSSDLVGHRGRNKTRSS